MEITNGKEMLEFIRENEKQGKVVVETFAGLMTANVDELILNQPAEGLLWDLNRDRLTCASWIEKEEQGWINNYAMAVVIHRMREMINEN